MTADSKFQGDDLRKTDPKFQPRRYTEYLEAVARLDEFAWENYGKRVLDLAVRWVLDQPGVTSALWGARHPGQLAAVDAIDGWRLDASAMKAIDEIVSRTVLEPVGPEFMAPPLRADVATSSSSGI
jgi:aryl-alcohol dehydrogenase-like predicted oxidoreductase